MASITNEVLAEKIDSLNLRLVSMEKKIDAMPSAFVSHEVLELKLAPLENKLTEVERRKSLLVWAIPTITAIFSSVMTWLVVERLR